MIRDVVHNESGRFPELADLPAHWDQIPPDEMAPDFQGLTEREVIVACYSNWAFSKRWAWDGLDRLLRTLESRGQPIPDTLKVWAVGVVTGSRTPPPKPRNPRYAPQDERNHRIMRLVRSMRTHGWSREKAIGEIADVLSKSTETIISAVRKVERDRPDTSGGTKRPR